MGARIKDDLDQAIDGLVNFILQTKNAIQKESHFLFHLLFLHF